MIGRNPFSPSALTRFLQLLKGNNRIVELSLSLSDVTSDHKAVVEDINKRRRKSKTPTLKLHPDFTELSYTDKMKYLLQLEQQGNSTRMAI